MITLSLTIEQFVYLQSAVRRDLEMLAEMAPWDIDDHQAEHDREIRLNKQVSRVLGTVEQEQVLPF